MASPDPTSRATGIALRNYEREVKFYNEVASSLDVRLPHCYFADWNEAGGDIAIVLEDMSPSEQGDQIRGCGIEEARLAVSELSRLHGPPSSFELAECLCCLNIVFVIADWDSPTDSH